MEEGGSCNTNNNNNDNSNIIVLPEAELVLQWGNRKRLRCMKVRGRDSSTTTTRTRGRRRMDMSTGSGALRKSYQEDRYYTTRGSVMGFDQHNNSNGNGNGEEKGGLVWPRLFISLSSKEKDEDFMAMKGCKLPHRPKKRPKFIQTTLLLVSPGAWLSDLCQERYEVRENKKTSKKRPRGLKAMGSMETDSE